jgi:hypothetical protein
MNGDDFPETMDPRAYERENAWQGRGEPPPVADGTGWVLCIIVALGGWLAWALIVAVAKALSQ